MASGGSGKFGKGMNMGKKMARKSALGILAVILFSVIFIFAGNRICNYHPSDSVSEEVETAKVVSVHTTEREEVSDNVYRTTVTFEGKITSGEYKGKVFPMQQTIDDMILPKPDEVKQGDRILVLNAREMGLEGDYTWIYASHDRIPSMIWLVAAFLLLVILIGRWKGAATVLTLGITFGTIFLVYIPSILKGYSIYLTTTIISVFLIFSSLLILNGFHRKTYCAVAGNVGGVLIAGLLGLAVNSWLRITGMVDQDYTFLTMLSSDVSIDLRAVVWGALLIGSLGAVMDVSMSIASAMQELSLEMREPTFQRMFKAGMNIGRDSIGTMTSTLILAYVGSSLAVILLFAAYNRDILMLLNFEMIVVEVIQAVVGSTGILFAVPVTVVISTLLFLRQKPAGEAEPAAPELPEKKNSILYTPLTKKAMEVCYQAHNGQLDKAGLPYVFHPFHLAEQMEDEQTVVTALLHDVVEDTPTTLRDLAGMGFPEPVLKAVAALTRNSEESYSDYIGRIKENPIARAVKLADLRHNSDLSRLDFPSEKDLERQKKYLHAIKQLEK